MQLIHQQEEHMLLLYKPQSLKHFNRMWLCNSDDLCQSQPTISVTQSQIPIALTAPQMMCRFIQFYITQSEVNKCKSLVSRKLLESSVAHIKIIPLSTIEDESKMLPQHYHSSDYGCFMINWPDGPDPHMDPK